MPWEDLDEELAEMFGGLSGASGEPRRLSFEERVSSALSVFAAPGSAPRPPSGPPRRRVRPRPPSGSWRGPPLRLPPPPPPPPFLTLLPMAPSDVDAYWPAFSALVWPRVRQPGRVLVRAVLAVGPAPRLSMPAAEVVGSLVLAFSPAGELLPVPPTPAKGVVRVAAAWSSHRLELCARALPTDALAHWRMQ